MKTTPKFPSYLVRNPYSYCFRMMVPKDLQTIVGKTELRYSLRTGYAGIARKKAQYLAGKIHLIFMRLRKGGTTLTKLTDDRIKTLLDQYIKETIQCSDESLYTEEIDQEMDALPFSDEGTFHSYVNSLDNIRNDLITNLNLGNFGMLRESIHALLKRNGIDDPDASTLEYRRLCAEIHKAEIQLLPFQKRHMLCDYSYKKELTEVFPNTFQPLLSG